VSNTWAYSPHFQKLLRVIDYTFRVPDDMERQRLPFLIQRANIVETTVTLSSEWSLDALFKLLVHTRPHPLFGLLLAGESKRRTVSPASPTITDCIRIDTQLAPTRLLPDAVYLVRTDSEDVAEVGDELVVVLEGQTRASTWPPWRTSLIVLALAPQVLALARRPQIRLLEVRTKSRAFGAATFANSPPGGIGFMPTNVLLDLAPDDSLFHDPDNIVLLGFSSKVTPVELCIAAERLTERALSSVKAPDNADYWDRLLLGWLCRARFPEHPLTVTMMETLMSEAQNIDTADFGQLTQLERLQLQRQVREEAQARESRLLKQAKEAGFSDGERQTLLDIVAKFAPEVLDELTHLKDAPSLRAAVESALASRMGEG
jgi:hypothetical protein